MKLAAIASDDAILPVLQAIESWEHGNVSSIWSENSSLKHQMHSITPESQVLTTWDELLEQGGIDFVVTAGVSESILTAAKQFLAAGFRLLVVISNDGPTAKIFEYTALWQEAAERVLPLFSSGVDELSQSVIRQFSNEEFGKLWKLNFHRTIKNSDSEKALSVDIAQRWFLQDCCWIRKIDPHVNLVTMTTTGPDADHPMKVNIRLTGENSLDVDWSIAESNEEKWQLELIGEKEKILIQCENNQKIKIESSSEIAFPEYESYVIADIHNQLEQINNNKPDSDWTDLIKLGEFGATANRSLLKRRTYPVHFEEASERSQFKSQMAAIGCGALLWAMFGMITLLAIGAVIDPRDREYLTSLSADYVIWNQEFSDKEATQLSEIGVDHVRKIAASWSSTSPVVIIEEANATVNAPDNINKERKDSVARLLTGFKAKDATSRIIVRPITGKWFETLMLLGWIIVFMPVGIVLIAQSLLVISRPIQR